MLTRWDPFTDMSRFQNELPRTIDVSSIEATLEDGLLTVRLPKREGVKARKIEVKR